MLIANTISNTALASSVNHRIRSDAAMIAAKALLWRLSALGVLCLLIGCAISVACYGYSYVIDSRTSATKMADAFAGALEHANLGTVRLNPESVVSLAAGATVKLDGGSGVKLDPGSVVRVAGEMPRPSEHQLSGGSDAKIVTNFTIFKSVPFEKGRVYSGWDFSSSEQVLPEAQFCYYQEPSNGSGESFTIALGRDGVARPVTSSSFRLDTAAAFAQCVWYR